MLPCCSPCHHTISLYFLYISLSFAIWRMPYSFPAPPPLLRFCLRDRPVLGPVIACHLWHRLPRKTACFFLASCGKWAPLPSLSHLSIPFCSRKYMCTQAIHTPAAPSLLLLAVDPAADRCWEGFQSPDTAATQKSVNVFEYVPIIQKEGDAEWMRKTKKRVKEPEIDR